MGYEGAIMTNPTVKTTLPRNALCVIFGVIAGLSAGCAGPTALEDDFGKSVRQMQYVQTYDKTTILDPQLDPVVGVDGQGAVETLKDYRKTFTKPTKDPVKQEIFFTVSGASGGGE